MYNQKKNMSKLQTKSKKKKQTKQHEAQQTEKQRGEVMIMISIYKEGGYLLTGLFLYIAMYIYKKRALRWRKEK